MKKKLLITLLIIWSLAATAYVLYDFWINFRDIQLRQTYDQGVTDAVNTIIDKVAANNCQPLPIFVKDKKMDIIDAKCSQASQE